MVDSQEIDFDGVILLPALCRLLQTGPDTIRQRVRAGTFPIPPLRGVDNRLRWSGPAVKRWLEGNGIGNGAAGGEK